MKRNILISAIALFIFAGWFLNLQQMNNMQVNSMPAVYIKGSGIILVPIGTVMGYIGIFKTV